MNLTLKQKKLLAILDDAPSDTKELHEITKKHLRISEETLKKEIEKFLKQKLIKKIKISPHEENFFWTNKVKKTMIDHEIRIIRDNSYIEKAIIYEIKTKNKRQGKIIIKLENQTPIIKKTNKLTITLNKETKGTLAITGIKNKKNPELTITSQDQKIKGTIKTTLKDLSEWTLIKEKEITEAINEISMDKTITLLKALPKKIILDEKQAKIELNPATPLSKEEVLRKIFNKENTTNEFLI